MFVLCMERPIHRDRDGMMVVIEYVYVMMVKLDITHVVTGTV
jgi:hypothetical protein